MNAHRDHSSAIRALGMAGVAAVVCFWAAMALLHALRPELSVLDDYVSDYVNGRWGSVFTLSVLAHGTGNVAITGGLALSLGGDQVVRFGVLAFGVAAAALFMAAIFPTDPAGAP